MKKKWRETCSNLLIRTALSFLFIRRLSSAFSKFPVTYGVRHQQSIIRVSLRSSLDDDCSADDEDDTIDGRFLLPPIGESSSDEELPERFRSKEKKTPVAFVGSQKFELQYTCKLCGTRNSHKVSRHAYTKGVVIAVCKGCKGKHLIADNLGWSGYIDGFENDGNNIEEYLNNQGRGEDINRVSPDVWKLENDLEKSKQYDVNRHNTTRDDEAFQ